MHTGSNIDELNILFFQSLEQAIASRMALFMLDLGVVLLVDDLLNYSPESIKLHWFGNKHVGTSIDERLGYIIIS